MHRDLNVYDQPNDFIFHFLEIVFFLCSLEWNESTWETKCRVRRIEFSCVKEETYNRQSFDSSRRISKIERHIFHMRLNLSMRFYIENFCFFFS